MITTNLVTKYNEAMRSYEKHLNADYKKNNGIFYTDLSLADLIIKELNVQPNSVVFDPCCGTGSFLIASAQNGIESIFGADKDNGAVKECLFHLENARIVNADTIGNSVVATLKKMGLKDKVDYVIGNPPYAPFNTNTTIKSNDYLFMRKVADCGNNLFIAALIRALEMVKPGGVVSYIIPKNFLHIDTYSLLRRELLREKTIVSIIDIGIYFKSVRGEQIVITVKNEASQKNKILLKTLVGCFFEKLTSIEQDFYTDEILLFKSDEELAVYKKMKSSYQTLKDKCTGYIGRGKSKSESAVSGKNIRKFGYKNIQQPTSGNKIFIQNIYSAESGIIASLGGDLDAGETVTIFTDGDEKMCRYILGVLHSRLCNFYLYKFCFNSSSLTMHTDAKYLKKMPLSIKDSNFEALVDNVVLLEKEEYMSDAWYDLLEKLNELVYEAYGINNEEAFFIDREMKRVQSKRWLKNGE